MSSTPGCHLDFQALIQTHDSLFARQHLEDLRIGEALRSFPKLTQRAVRLTNWEDADVGCHILKLCCCQRFRHGVTVTMCDHTRYLFLYIPNRTKYDTSHENWTRLKLFQRSNLFAHACGKSVPRKLRLADLLCLNTVVVRQGKSHNPAL